MTYQSFICISNDSKSRLIDNNHNHFEQYLDGAPVILEDDTDQYEICLSQLRVSLPDAYTDPLDLIIYTDIVKDEQHIGHSKASVVKLLSGCYANSHRIFTWAENNTVVNWLPIAATSFNRITTKVVRLDTKKELESNGVCIVVYTLKHKSRN